MFTAIVLSLIALLFYMETEYGPIRHAVAVFYTLVGLLLVYLMLRGLIKALQGKDEQ